MARQSNEDLGLLQGIRKSAVTRRVESGGGGKWVPVIEETRQSVLNFEAAENPKASATGVDGGAAGGQSLAAPCAAPQSKSTTKRALSATMEEVIEHLQDAFRKVASNKGAPGPDGKSIEEVREHLDVVLARLGRSLREGTYAPGDIRRVWIPKGGGGQRQGPRARYLGTRKNLYDLPPRCFDPKLGNRSAKGREFLGFQTGRRSRGIALTSSYLRPVAKARH